jgi:hypothetical protein
VRRGRLALFNRAIADEELTRNPFKGLSRKTRGRKDKIPLSDADLNLLCEFALRIHGSYGAMMRALILFGKRADKHGRYELVDFYELRHRAAWWMHVELGMPSASSQSSSGIPTAASSCASSTATATTVRWLRSTAIWICR